MMEAEVSSHDDSIPSIIVHINQKLCVERHFLYAAFAIFVPIKLGKTIKKFGKILLIVTAVIVAIPLTAVLVVMLPPVQRNITNSITQAISSVLGTDVSVGHVSLMPICSLTLDDVLITDSNNDTLAYSKTINIDVDVFSLLSEKTTINLLVFDGLQANIYKTDSAHFNFSHIFEHINQDKTDVQSDSANAKISIEAIDIDNSSAHIRVDNNSYSIDSISLGIDAFEIDSNRFALNIKHLNIYESNNRVRLSLKSKFKLANDTIIVDSLRANSNSSIARISHFAIKPASDSTWQDGYLSAKIDTLLLRGREMALLPYNIGRAKRILFCGELNGQNSNISGKGIKVSAGNESMLNMEFEMKDFFDPKQLFVSVKCHRLNTTLNDIGLLSGADISKFEKANENVGKLSYNGLIQGYLNDIKLDGLLTSNIGKIRTNSTINIKPKDVITLNGKISTASIDLGKLTDNKLFGTAGCQISVNAGYSPDGNSFAHINGSVDQLVFNNYKYDKIDINGLMRNKHFDGFVGINDPSGRLYFVGEVDYSRPMPHYGFTVKLEDVRVDTLGLMPKTTNGLLNMTLQAQLDGKSIDDALGNIWLGDMSLKSDNKLATNKSTYISIERDQDGEKHLSIESEKINGNVTGDFTFTGLIDEAISQVARTSPTLFKYNKEPKHKVNDASLDIYLDGIKEYTQFILPEIEIAEAGHIYGYIDSKRGSSDLVVEMKQFKYLNFNAEGIAIEAQTAKDDKTRLTVDCQQLTVPLLDTLGNIRIQQTIDNDTLQCSVIWNNWKDKSGAIYSTTNFARGNSNNILTQINLHQSNISFSDSIWTIDPCKIDIDNDGFAIDTFNIHNNTHYIAATGRASRSNPNHILTLTSHNLVLSDFIKTDENSRATLHGYLNTAIRIGDIYNNPTIDSDIEVNELVVNGDSLGQLAVSSLWEPIKKQLSLATLMTNPQGHICVDGSGTYNHTSGFIDVGFDIDSLSVGFLNFYIGHAVQNIKGTTSGHAAFKGKTNELQFFANLALHNTTLSVDQTKVSYRITDNDSIFITPTNMTFENIKFYDKHKHQGIFSGNISHNMFSDLMLNLSFDCKNMLVLETTPTDNPIYYGTVFADGNMHVSGGTSDIDINITASPRENSIFSVLPLESSDLSENTFIKFVHKDAKIDSKPRVNIDYKELLSSVKASIDLNITPAATIQAIIDKETNNMMRGNGQGRVRLNINNQGQLTIFGDYTLNEGFYNYSFENIVNKRFVINQGSTAHWDGDPYNASINLSATYKVKASLYDLVSGSNTSDFQMSELRRRVPINCNLKLTDRLMNPTIKFDIEIPSSQNFSQYTFEQYVNTEEETNRQVFSLLIANRFYTPSDVQASDAQTSTSSSSSYLGTTASELISNQLSSWLSQNKYNVGVGVNYRPGDEVTNEEYEVALSTQVLNDKVILSGNFGYGRNTTEASESNFIGDFDVEVKLNKKGNLRAKAYTHSNNDVIYETSPTTQGIGLAYHEEFRTFGELIKKYWDKITGRQRRARKEQSKQQPAESTEMRDERNKQ